MKNLIANTFSLSIITSAALALTGCTADIFNTQLPEGCNTMIEAICETPVADGETDTRTAIDPTEYAGGEIGVNWMPNDKIGVYGNAGSGNVAFDNMAETESAGTSFAGTLKDGEKPLYAYYPYNPDASDDPSELSGNLTLTQHYSTATRELEGDWKVGAPLSGSSSQFKFTHIFSFLKFEVNGADTDFVGEELHSVSLKVEDTQLGGIFTYDIVKGTCSFTPAAYSDCVTMEWTDKPALTTSTFHGYMNVAPCTGLSGKKIDITITTSRHIIKFSQTAKIDEFKANTYYTIPLTLSDYKGIWTVEDNPDAVQEENAAWVPGLESRLACANTVFALTGQPFMHKIRVPEDYSTLTDFNYNDNNKSGHYVVPVKSNASGSNEVIRVYNLPEGLHWNNERKLVYGTPEKAGDFVYSVEYKINGQTYAEGIKLAVRDSYPQATPMMGWQSWNVMRFDINDELIRKQIDAMASDYLASGYNYVGIDDGWSYHSSETNHYRRLDNDGNIAVDSSKFRYGLASLTQYAHSKNIRLGIYSDVAYSTCGGYPGSYNREATDAAAFATWGFDMLKEDYFSDYMDQYFSNEGTMTGLQDKTSRDVAKMLYKRMGDALAEQSHHVLLYMCEWGTHQPWRWAPEVGAQCWRMSYDDADGWYGAENGMLGVNSNSQNKGRMGLRNTIDLMRNLWSYTGINRFNDADMICAGIRGQGNGPSNEGIHDKNIGVKNNYGLTDDETQTAFAMWCMWSSPILLGFDLSQNLYKSSDKELLTNPELIAINQDKMGQGAEWVKKANGLDYYMKDLANGDVAIAVVNLNDNSARYTIALSDFEALDSNNTYKVRNLLKKADEAGVLSASASLSGTLDAHGTFIVRLVKQ